jgi:hypothetical protein
MKVGSRSIPARLTSRDDERHEVVRIGDFNLEFFKSEGGLDVDHEEYDAPIVEDIQVALGFSTDGDLDDQLSTHPVSIEQFLGALLTSIRPFTQMMTDLLTLFEKAGARRTNDGLGVRFDFESDDVPDLDFDLDHFRDWLEQWRHLRQSALVRV